MLHLTELFEKDRPFGFWLLVGFGTVNKQPYDIEESAEPCHDENDVQGLYIKIHSIIRLNSNRKAQDAGIIGCSIPISNPAHIPPPHGPKAGYRSNRESSRRIPHPPP